MLKPNPHTAIAERLEELRRWALGAPDWQCLDEAAQALRASADEVERVKGERDEAKFAYNTSYDLGSQWCARAEKAEADLASARKALEEIEREAQADELIAAERVRSENPTASARLTAQVIRLRFAKRAQEIAAEALRASTIGEEGEGLPGPRPDDLSIMRGEAEAFLQSEFEGPMTDEKRAQIAASIVAVQSNPSPTPTAEEVARIIDSAAFYTEAEQEDFPESCRMAEPARQRAMTKANAIIELFQPEGRERP